MLLGLEYRFQGLLGGLELRFGGLRIRVEDLGFGVSGARVSGVQDSEAAVPCFWVTD